LTTPRTGAFTLPVLLPGVYTVAVERLGYRPVRVRGIALRPGRRTHLELVLSPVAPPVRQVMDRQAAAGVLEDTRAGAGEGFPRLALVDLPDVRRDATDLGRLASMSTSFLETEGLAARLGGFTIQRVPFAPARHPGLMHGDGDGAALPLSSLGWAELVTGEGDVEWSELAGARVAGELRRGASRGHIGGFGESSTDALSSSRVFDTGAAPHETWRLGLLASGPIVRDTAFFAVGVDYQRRETPWPGGWTADSLTPGLAGLAQDSFGVDITPYAEPRVSSVETGAAFGRVDLLLGSTAVTAHATAAKLSAADPDLGPRPTAPLAAKLDGTDFTGGLIITSALSRVVIPELSVAYEASEREYRQRGVAPATTVAAGGLAFGGDPALPARFEHHAARATLSLGVHAGGHRVKLGGSVVADWYDQVYAYGRAGEFFFTDSAGFAATRGVFTQTVGALPVAQYSRTQFAAFLQDWWTAAPGLDVLLGARLDFAELPVDDIRRNDRWLELTGLDNTAVDEHRINVSPRVGVRWNIGGGRWLVRGGMGMYHGLADPAVLAEWLSHTGAVAVRRGVGDLDAWPGAPDSVAAPVQGPWLTLLEPEFQGPRTTRFHLGISHPLSPDAVVHVSGVYRHT
ncbi:MAG: TonB-dependent receptor domain-containing protein, partial [Gemmatimonadales bacterium]